MINKTISLNIPTSVGNIRATIAPNPSHDGFTVSYNITQEKMNLVREELVSSIIKYMNENHGYNLTL